MVDACIVRRQTGQNREATGEAVPVYGQTVYAGRCRLQLRGLAGQNMDVGEQRVDLLRAELQLPIAVTGLAVDDRVEITASLDPDLAGRLFRLSDLFHKTHATARRVMIEEVVG